VAFLGPNSADLLLAVMACMNINGRVLPVLLNTRWTFQEIAQALMSQNNKQSSDDTLLVHVGSDENHRRLLQRAADLLQQQSKGRHHVSIFELASISESYREKAALPLQQQQQGDSLKTSEPQMLVAALDATKIVSDCRNRGYNDNNSVIINNDNGNYDDSHDTAIILFTSGTTSGSKGVLLSHRALYIQALAKLGPPCRYDANTKMLATTVPLFHVGGLSSTLAVLLAGGSLVFPPEQQQQQQQQQTTIAAASSFQPDAVIQSIQQGPHLSSNTLVVVPAMLASLMDQLNNNSNSSSSRGFPWVRLVLIGGQSATPSLLQHVFQRFPNAKVVQTYACTEGASSLTFWERTPNEQLHSDGQGPQEMPSGDCIGHPPSHISLCLFPTNADDSTVNTTKSITKPFTPGVIATRGPHLLTGYWRRGSNIDIMTIHSIHKSNTIPIQKRQQPQQSSIYAYESPTNPDGWFVTNDLGYIDEQGRYYFCGRVADVIRTGGETVLAPEVERILLRHQDIAECAVFALPDDPKFGETVCAAIVLRQDAPSKPTLAELRHWCGQHGLAGYKRPRRLIVVSTLPRNSSGKLLKRLLVERFRNHNASPSLQSKL